MPISLASPMVEYTIARIGGTDKLRQHLMNLGFIEGEKIMVINRVQESVIVKLKGVSLAITTDLAKKIYV